MASREEKLSAARRKLREFQGKARDGETKEFSRKSSTASSPSPGFPQAASNDEPRSESPLDAARQAWERRQTIPADDPQQKLLNVGQTNDVAISFGSDDSEKEKIGILEMQCNSMREQLHRQGQVITVLVSERNEAQTALSRVQSELQQKSDALEDIKNKYSEASRRVHEFENSPSRLVASHSPFKEEELKQKISMLQEQLSEMNVRLGAKNVECEALTKKVLDLENSLSVSQVKIQQLTIDEGSVANDSATVLQEANEALQKENALLKRKLQATAMEELQASHRIQVYADKCNAQQATLRSQLREAVDEAKSQRDQNESLKAQIEALHSQMNQKSQEEQPLVSRIDELCKETAMLSRSLQEKDMMIANLEQEVKASVEQLAALNLDLENARYHAKRIEAKADGGRPDPALLAAMESDKVAASRAVAQNQKLKDHIAELQNAFMRVSDEKLALMDKLSRAEHENAQLLKNTHSHNHEHHDEDCDHSDEPEEEDAETLRHLVAALRRDKTELIDRLHQSQNVNGHHNHNQDHHHDHEHEHHHDDQEHCHDAHSNKELIELRRVVAQLQEDKAELLRRLNVPGDDPEVQGLLETKLTKTMNEIAKLDEEKERLEHLVLQLQGETETIGEYITLYHKQRIILKQRSVEKDEQLHQLSKDREELKEKLESLNGLVAKLVNERESGFCVESLPEGIEEATALKIKALITEIGNNNVVNSHSVAFNQCSCCSGRLITV